MNLDLDLDLDLDQNLDLYMAYLGVLVGPSRDLHGTILGPSGAILGVWICRVDPVWYPGWIQMRLPAPGARFSAPTVDSSVDSDTFGCTR